MSIHNIKECPFIPQTINRKKVRKIIFKHFAICYQKGVLLMNKQYQVTLICSTGKYRPESCIVTNEQEVDIDLSAFDATKKELIKKGMSKICAKHYWSGADLKKYGYTKVKIRAYDKEKIEAEKKARYEAIKEEKYASGEWKRPKSQASFVAK